MKKAAKSRKEQQYPTNVVKDELACSVCGYKPSAEELADKYPRCPACSWDSFWAMERPLV